MNCFIDSKIVQCSRGGLKLLGASNPTNKRKMFAWPQFLEVRQNDWISMNGVPDLIIGFLSKGDAYVGGLVTHL
jgi:hypothetical protein